MKIREEPTHHAKIESWKNEQVRRPGTRHDSALPRARHRLERPGCRCADSDDAPPAIEGAVDFGRGRLADVVSLRFEPMVFDPIDADRLKCSIAHVKGDLDGLNTAPAERVHHWKAEVQARGRRGN